MYKIILSKIIHTIVAEVTTLEDSKMIQEDLKNEGFDLVEELCYYASPNKRTLIFEKKLFK